MRTRGSNYGDLGLRSGLVRFIRKCKVAAAARQPVEQAVVRAQAQRVVTVIPFVATSEGFVVAEKGFLWTRTHRLPVDRATVVDVYFGRDWRAPPYDPNGVVLRVTLAESTTVIHVGDLTVTIGDVIAAMTVATKVCLEGLDGLQGLEGLEGLEGVEEETSADNDGVNTLNMDLYDRVAHEYTVLCNTTPLCSYAKEGEYSVAQPMRLRMLLR